MQTQKQWLDMTTDERMAYLQPMVGQQVRVAFTEEVDKRRLAFGKDHALKWYNMELKDIVPLEDGVPGVILLAREIQLLGFQLPPIPAPVKWSDIHAIELLPEATPQRMMKGKHASFCCPNCGHPLIVGKGQ